MKITEIQWDETNRGRVTRCSRDEVEEVLWGKRSTPRVADVFIRNGEQRRVVHGMAKNGRLLVVVITVIAPRILRPVTCYPMQEIDQQSYAAWRLTVERRRSRQARRSNPTAALPEWPLNKLLPNFKSWEEEDLFWRSWSFANLMETFGEPMYLEWAVKKPATGTSKARKPGKTSQGGARPRRAASKARPAKPGGRSSR
jgi:uncharacterized DUF497 family protein